MKIQEDYFTGGFPTFKNVFHNLEKTSTKISKEAASQQLKKQLKSKIFMKIHTNNGFVVLTLGIQARNYWLLRNIYDLIKRKAHLTINALPENAGAMG